MAALPPGVPDERRHLPRTPSSEFTFKRFGRQTYLQEKRVMVGISLVTVVNSNPDRLFYTLTNRGGSNISIGFSSDLTVLNGILVPAAGGWISQHIDDDGDVVAWQVFGISAALGQLVYVIEILGAR